MLSRWAVTFCLLCMANLSRSQSITQNIRGVVIDKGSRRPLAGATLSLVEDSVRGAVISNESGQFEFKNVSVGRYRISCSYTGYELFVTDNFALNSARELELAVELEPLYQQQSEVRIKALRNPKQPVNRSSVVSTRSFTPEETSRYAAGVNDPSRMAMSFPGVQPTRDARSDIIIRGNSPTGMLWRLEGIDIPNPNHFARKGSSGGGITIFSSSMLANSDFSSGAFPAEYGDALSGVFDMRFRNGNREKNQYSFKAGIIGIDFSAEGPLKKGSSSFLLNYRYSTLGILNKLGFHLTDEREDNTFQDISFNLAFPSKNKRSVVNVWGIGGKSHEDYDAIVNAGEWDEYDDYAIYDFITNMGAAGIGHTLQVGTTGVLKTSFAIMDQKISYVDDTLNDRKEPFTINDELYKNNRLSLALSYQTRFGGGVSMKTGGFISRIGYRFNQSLYDFNAAAFRSNIIEGQGNTLLWQPYTQFTFKIGPKFVLNTGLHAMYLALNNTHTIEPRFSIQYRINPNHTTSLAVGQHGKTLPLGSYFFKAPNGELPNLALEMMKSTHFVWAYDWLMNKNWRLHLEAYFQKLRNIPVVDDANRTFWLLNMIDGYANEALVSLGKGENKGVDITVEKFFSKGWFLLTGFSFFNATYSPLNGRSYNTQYNSRTAGSFTTGHEWKWKKNKIFGIGGKALYNGGMPISPLLAGAPVNSREPVLDEANPYSETVPPYFRMDARFTFRKDKVRRAWVLALDIQNMLGIKNTDALSRRFDPATRQWIYKKSSGLIPVISYQLDF